MLSKGWNKVRNAEKFFLKRIKFSCWKQIFIPLILAAPQALFPWGCVDYELDDVRNHPTFAPSMPRPTWVLLSVINYFKWAHIAIISSSDDTWVETATKVGMLLFSHVSIKRHETRKYANDRIGFLKQVSTKQFVETFCQNNSMTTYFICFLYLNACCLFSTQVADSLRSHGLPVRLVSFMENTPHGIRRTLSKLRKMKEIRSEFHFWPHVYSPFTYP